MILVLLETIIEKGNEVRVLLETIFIDIEVDGSWDIRGGYISLEEDGGDVRIVVDDSFEIIEVGEEVVLLDDLEEVDVGGGYKGEVGGRGGKLGDESLVVVEEIEDERVIDDEVCEGGRGGKKINDVGGTSVIKMDIEYIIVIILCHDGVKEWIGGEEGEGRWVITDATVWTRDGKGNIQVLGDTEWGIGVGGGAVADGEGGKVGGG